MTRRIPKRFTAFYTARKNARLTQAQAGKLADVPQTVISDLETGKITNPSWAVLSKLAQVYGVRPEQLIPYVKLPKRKLALRRLPLATPLYEAAV